MRKEKQEAARIKRDYDRFNGFIETQNKGARREEINSLFLDDNSDLTQSEASSDSQNLETETR
jgi:hypothetical protein